MIKAIDEPNMIYIKQMPGTATVQIYPNIIIQTIDITCTKKDISIFSPPISSWDRHVLLGGDIIPLVTSESLFMSIQLSL